MYATRLQKGSGNVGTPGCVSFMFDEKGQIFVAKKTAAWMRMN